VSKIVKIELAKRDMNYIQLTEKLNEMGVPIKTQDLRSRMSRGNFSATFFVQCLRAMEIKTLVFEDSYFLNK
jgi:hypothetical protein